MEEIFEQNAEAIKGNASLEVLPANSRGWREFLETDAAVRVIYLAFGFFAIMLVMILLQFQTNAICCGDWDGYYHIRWSALLWESLSSGKWLPSFDWLPLTVLNANDYNDHHFLFHLLQIPFLWFLEPVMAAKISTVFYSTLAIFSCYWLIYRYGVKHQLIWLAALLTCANAFYFRMNMAKAPPLTIIISVVGIYLLFERKYVWLLPLMFAFVWTYSLFPLLLFGALIWVAIIAWNERRFEWRPLAYTLSGMILGNVINPYFPNNLLLFWEHFYTKFKVGSDFAVAVGGEWYPYSGMELLLNFPIALLAMLIGYILFAPKSGKLPEKATFFLIFTTILLAAQFRSKRFAEYFPPFAILFAAFSWNAFDMRNLISPSIKSSIGRVARQSAVWIIGLVLVGWGIFNLRGIDFKGIQEQGLISTIRGNEDADKYRRAMEWATGVDKNGTENIPAGEMIFNCTWDDFPKLFFYDQKHSYAYGLDPNYLYSENPELYKLLVEITTGKTDDPAPLIRERFNSRFIFTDIKENDDMVKKLLESGWADKVYEDRDARFFKLRDTKGNPPVDDENVDGTIEAKESDGVNADAADSYENADIN
ncbi:MAG: hypothetical protein WBD22_15135 [Pyrinomonadaceae bacterium]